MKKALLVTVFSVAVCAAPFAYAKGGGGGRTSYGGGHHTASHGGSYAGGQGSSHRGGAYRNSKTGNQYGTHK